MKAELGLDYVKENIFLKRKEQEVMQIRKDQIIKLYGLKNSKGSGYFDLDFLSEKWMGLTYDQLMINKKLKEKLAEEKAKEEAEGEEGTEEGTEEAGGGEEAGGEGTEEAGGGDEFNL